MSNRKPVPKNHNKIFKATILALAAIGLFVSFALEYAYAATPEVLVHINTAKFIALGGTDSQGRDSMASSLANDLTYEILTPPQHGTLSGNLIGVKTAVLTYVPTIDYQGPDSFTYCVHDGGWTSPEYTIYLKVAPWTLPIGILDPGFGIQESHRMYADQQFDFDGDGVLEPGEEYRDAGNGPYTHYVDASNPLLATDAGNPYGTPALPRRTIPYNLPAGSVVEIHNTENHGITISGSGTQSNPIFVRGPNAVNRAPMNGFVDIGYFANATHIIIENIDTLYGVYVCTRQDGTDFTNSYIALRNSEIHGSYGTAATIWSQNKVHDVMFYNNIIHDNFEETWDPATATGDEDHCGIAIGGTYNIWVLDNEMYHNSGDGLQIHTGYGDFQDGGGAGYNIYVGRNVAHHNKQSGLWVKQATHVFFSQNTVYGHRVSSSSNGAGMGFQCGPENVWFLFNHSYDNTQGIATAGGHATNPGQNSYFIGNVIHDIHAIAMYLKGGVNRHVIGNTIYDVGFGILGSEDEPDVGSLEIVNNIIANVTDPATAEIFVNSATLAAATVLWNNLFYRGGEPIRISWGDDHVYDLLYDLPTFQATFPGVANGSFEADPFFVDPANNDFHLQADSPAIDKGIETTIFKTFHDLYGIDIRKDYDANVRPEGQPFDIGAYEYTPPSGDILYGDVNGVGGVDANDASLTAMAAVELITLTDEQVKKADVNNNGQPDANDASLIAQYAVGLIDKFPVGG